MLACRANLLGRGEEGSRVFKTNINLSGKRDAGLKHEIPRPTCSNSWFHPQRVLTSIHFSLKILTAHRHTKTPPLHLYRALHSQEAF